MKSNGVYVLILSLLISAMSCEKDYVAGPISMPLYDTIYPISYFPVYPGSYWRYIDSNNDTVLSKTAPSYHLDFYIRLLHYDTVFNNVTYSYYKKTSDTCFVPVLDGQRVWRYQYHTTPWDLPGKYSFTKFLSDTLPVGSTWTTGSDTRRGMRWFKKIGSKDSTIVISKISYYPTIVIEDYVDVASGNILTGKNYYAKDIGLIKSEHYNYNDKLISSKDIIDYYINN